MQSSFCQEFTTLRNNTTVVKSYFNTHPGKVTIFTNLHDWLENVFLFLKGKISLNLETQN